MSDNLNMVTLTTVSSLVEADMLRSRLESSGITTLLPDEGVISVNPLYTGTVGGVRVQVGEKDLSSARGILDLKNASVAKGVFECPKCSSDLVDIEYANLPRFLALLSVLCLGLPLLWFKKQCRCRICGATWREAP